MIEWNEQHLAIREAFKRFVDSEIAPKREELEHGNTPPYDVLRKMFATFGLREMAEMRFQADLDKAERPKPSEPSERKPNPLAGEQVALQMIPIIELSRHSPGMVTALGVSAGLTANTIMSRGTRRQKERWALDLLRLDKIGAWAITEPESGSDAASIRTTARRVDGGYVLSGQKAWISNGGQASFYVVFATVKPGSGSARRGRASAAS